MKNLILFAFAFSLLIISCEKEPLNITYEEEPYEGVTFKDVVLSKGIPVEGAVVSIYGMNERYFDVTDAEGKYNIQVPTQNLLTSGFMSLNIYHPDYEPVAVIYEAPLLDYSVNSSNDLSASLETCENCLEVFTARYSELIHLGDNNFSGSINSQFQKESDGLEYSFEFANSNNVNTKLRIGFEAKGLQPNDDENRRSARVVFGSQIIELEMSPEDGSYADYNIEFENELGIETITFITSDPRASDGDVDDWELTSFYVKGLD